MANDLKPILGARPFFEDIDSIIVDIRHALEQGELAQGPKIPEFENIFKKEVGSEFCAAVSSGGSALELCLKTFGVEGKEVLVPTNTFVATGNAVTLAGGKPIFVDTEPDTLCMDPFDLEEKITTKTVGVIYVPFFGLIPPSVLKIEDVCKRNKLFFLEDAAHAHGASYAGRNAGTFGDASCFSFFATKVITTGEGGAVTTRREDVNNSILRLRNHGKSLSSINFEVPSNNYRLNEIAAILGIHQVKTLKNNVKRRSRISKMYREGLASIRQLTMLREFSLSESSHWRFPTLLEPGVDKNNFQLQMWEESRARITWMYEPLCHLQPVFKDSGKYKVGDLPNAEDSLRRLVCLPTHSAMSDNDVERVISGVQKYFK